MDVTATTRPRHIRLEPSTGWVALQLRELWEYRELLYFLVWRDIKVRYKQTALGAAWAIIQPLFTMVVFTVFFGRLAKMPSDGVPYPIFALRRARALDLLRERAHAVGRQPGRQRQPASRKVYFPRLPIPHRHGARRAWSISPSRSSCCWP